MDNGIFDFKRKIAFAAALVFVSNTLSVFPASAAPESGRAEIHEAHESHEREEVSAEGDADHEDTDAPDVTEPDTDVTEPDIDVTEPDHEHGPSEGTEYKLRVNIELTDDELLKLVSSIFKLDTLPEYTRDEENAYVFTLESGATLDFGGFFLDEERTDKRCSVYSKSDNEIICDVYYRIGNLNKGDGSLLCRTVGDAPDAEHYGDNEYMLYVNDGSESGFEIASLRGVIEGDFCKAGSVMTFIRHDEYYIMESDGNQDQMVGNIAVSVDKPYTFVNQSDDVYKLVYDDECCYRIQPKHFKLSVPSDCTVSINGVQSQQRSIKWKDIGKVSISSEDKLAFKVTIPNTDFSRCFEIKDQKFTLEELFEALEGSDYKYKNAVEFSFETVGKQIRVDFVDDEDNSNIGTYEQLDVEKRVVGGRLSCFIRVPYLKGDDYYCAEGEEKLSEELKGDEDGNAKGYFELPCEYGRSTMTVRYKRTAVPETAEKCGFLPEADTIKRSRGCCYMNSVEQVNSIISSLGSSDGSYVSYEYVTKSQPDRLITRSFAASDRAEAELTDIADDIVFIRIKNVIFEGEEIAGGLLSPICFYNDTSAPKVSIKGNGSASSEWKRDKVTFALEVKDSVSSHINEKKSSSYEGNEINEVFDSYINNCSVDDSIAMICVGDYEFEKPEDGWSGTITGSLRSGADDRKKAVPSLSFDGSSFKVTFKVKSLYKEEAFTETARIYAVDVKDNIGRSRDEVLEVTYSMDGAAPTINDSNIRVENAVNHNVQDGTDNYIIREGSILCVDLDDLFEGTEGSGIRYAKWSFVDSDTEKYLTRWEDGSNTYKYAITADDLKDGPFRNSLVIKVCDNTGNETTLDTSAFLSLIWDNMPPGSGFTDAAAPVYDFVKETDGGSESWVSKYENIRFGIMGTDGDLSKGSGIQQLLLDINDQSFTVELDGSSELDRQCLEDNEYFIAAEPSEGDSFRVYIGSLEDDSLKVYIGGSEQSFTRMENGRITFKYHTKDYAELESNTDERTVYADLSAPTVASAYMDGRDILVGGDFRFEAFSDHGTDLTVIVNDDQPSSGIKQLTAVFYDTVGNVVSEQSLDSADNGVYRVPVPENFKGIVELTAYDNVGRVSDTAVSLGIITENMDKHSEEEHLFVSIPATDYRDRDGLPLYNSPIDALFTVRDYFSGIREVLLNADGEEYRFVAGRSESPDWTVVSDESGLITEVTLNKAISGSINGSRIFVRMTDNAGNESVEERGFSIDTDDPVINVVFEDENGSADSEYSNIFKAGRTAVITITERNFDSSLVDVRLGGQRQELQFTLVEGEAGQDNAKYRAELRIEKDGVYTLTVDCRDMGDRQAVRYDSGEFIIDTTRPVLDVTFDKGARSDRYFNESVTATLRITDANFDPARISISGSYNDKADSFPTVSEWTTIGDVHVATVKFVKNGDYELNISGRDKAGNPLEAYSKELNIDTVVPSVDFGDISKSNNGEEIRPTIRFDDPNLNKDSIRIELDGANRGKSLEFSGQLRQENGRYVYVFDNFPVDPEYDDIYTIRATAEDNASNKTEKKIRFSVNRYGSTFLLDDDTQAINGRYVSSLKDVVITEYNADRHAKDRSVFITKDSQMLELVEGIDYIVEESGGLDEWSEYRYRIFSGNFSSDARYTVSIHTVDEAGNVNISDSAKKQAEVSFYVDKTKPLCIPLNISDNSTYKGESYTARVSVSDNIVLKNIRVYVNGVPVNSRLDDDECSFNIPNSSSAQSVSIVLTDMAGNTGEYSYKNILVTTNVLRLLVRRTWFKVSAGLTLLLTGAAALFIRRRKNRLL